VQASLLGAVLAGGAWLWKRAVDWRQGGRTIVRGTAVAGPDSQTVKAALPPSVQLPPAPTTTLAAPHAEVAGEPTP
jgi:hypothetical protein